MAWFDMNNKKLTRFYLLVLLGIIIALFWVVFGAQDTNKGKGILNPNTQAILSEGSEGIIKTIGDSFNVFKNDVVGIQFEYPTELIGYGELAPLEESGFSQFYDTFLYQIYINNNEETFAFLKIRPTEFADINEWFEKDTKKGFNPEDVERENILLQGYDAIIFYPTLENPPQGFGDADVNIQLGVIKDGTLYTMFTQPFEGNRKIVESFKFLE